MPVFSFPLFGCFLIFLAWFSYERKKVNRKQQQQEEDFWRRESEANFSRRKNLDLISYITIPYDTFPMGRYTGEPAIDEAEEQLLALKDKRMLNLTGMTATDLKLEYGVANLPQLNEYDENYILMLKTLQKYAEALCSLQHTDDAVIVLEFAIASGSDIKATYMLLADIYHTMGMQDKIEVLITEAQKLNSLMKTPIINALKDL